VDDPSEETLARVHESYAHITETYGGQALTERFYRHFFARHPEVEELFGRHSFAAQQHMLFESLTGVMDHLDNADWLETNMHALGIKHHDYEVTREMYEWWAESMVETLESLSGQEWTEALREAWLATIGHVCRLVRDAGEGAPDG
jgi:hemoglobin-like flavoprotein